MVVAVGNVQGAAGVNGYIRGRVKLAVSPAEGAELCEKSACRIKNADPVVSAVGDVDGALTVHTYPFGGGELTVTGAGAPEREKQSSRCAELPDPRGACHIDISCRVQGDA